ncbi:hypothetical protein UlMin_014188 [Ulmus minor]
MSTRSEHHQMVPLLVLLKRELANEKIESPEIVHGQASQSKKGKDFTLVKTECQRVVGDGISTYSVFALFDGHNGSAAAIYSKENLLNNVLVAIPSDLNRDEWIVTLPRVLVAGFVKTDKDFQERAGIFCARDIYVCGCGQILAQMSGTIATFVIIEGWVITVASVGASCCILEAAKRGIYYLSTDHRLDCNEEDRLRITISWGEVGHLNTGSGAEIGPLRCWPGGLCLSRSIGDRDVGEYIVPVPYVKQVKSYALLFMDVLDCWLEFFICSEKLFFVLMTFHESYTDICCGKSIFARVIRITLTKSLFFFILNLIIVFYLSVLITLYRLFEYNPPISHEFLRHSSE